MANEVDDQQVLENAGNADRQTAGDAEESVEQKITRLEKEKGDLESKNHQLFERLKKQPSETAPQKTDSLSPREALVLAKLDIAPEDVDTIIDFANFSKASVTDAMNNATLKAILRDRTEERRSANATNVRGANRSATPPSQEAILSAASQGQLPQDETDISSLAEARMASKRRK